MKHTHITSAASLAAICLSGAIAPAATISIGTITGPSDIVNTGGTLVAARNLGGATSAADATVNGILHVADNSEFSPFEFGGQFITVAGGLAADPDLAELIAEMAGTAEANLPATITVPGLSVGTQYLFQAYYKVQNSFGSERALQVTLEGDTLSNIAANVGDTDAVLISYDFVAGDDTFNGAFQLTANTGPNLNTWLQGFSLQVIPEPSGLALVSLAGLVLLRRRR